MDGSVQFLLGKIDALLTGELNLPKRVNHGIKDRKFELESITAFLKKTHDQRAVEQDDQILAWVRQVQAVADDIDTVLDRYSYYQTEKGITRVFAKWREIHSIEDEIDRINSTLKNINQTTDAFLRTNSTLPGSRLSQCRNTHNSFIHSRVAPLYLADADVVGFEEDKDVLVPWALDMSDDHKTIFVVGMGGSGKTTLVKQVFEAVKGDFDCYAWISVSKSAKELEMLWNLLDQLCNPRAETTATPWHQRSADSHSLINRLRDYLQDKRYVIVLDDLWIDDVWESIKFAFPEHNSSRIIITTRRGDIANSRKSRFIDVHNIQHLPPEKAEKLFHRKAFPGSQTCPPNLAGLSKDILRKSEGLPLAILEIGQLLSTKEESASEWKRLMHDGLASELKRNGHLANITRVLILSYNDLPYHLKNCFLLMNTFPPNYPIQRRKLIQLWIAEGFIKEENNGKELEDVAEKYLNELIERSLILVREMDFDGRPGTLRVHNIVREIFLSVLQDENFCEVHQEQGIIGIDNERTRRISIHKGDLGSLCPNHHARALLIFDLLTPYRHSIPSSYSRLTDLRILHLEGANLDKFPAEIEGLLLLRYLCLRNTRINSIPKFIGNFKYLETLDLKQTFVRILPKEICHLSKLRNLLVSRYDIEHYVAFDTVKGFEVELAGELKCLANLRKLSFVQVHKDSTVIFNAIRRLTKMRKLGIIGLSQKDGRILCETIQKLPNLHSLNVTAETEMEILDMQDISCPPPLQRLYLNGRLERMPIWISKLHDLKRLRLKWSRLDQQSNNPIEILQDLPNLLELQLYDAYDGNQLDFNAGKFAKLKILEFEQLRKLKMVIMETNTLPCLQTLIIRRCRQLRQIPVGIEKLGNLKEIHLYDMPQPFLSMLQKHGGSLYRLVHHIPLIRSYHARDGGRWAVKDLS